MQAGYRFQCPRGKCYAHFTRHVDLVIHLGEAHNVFWFCRQPNCKFPGSTRASTLQTHMEKKHKNLFNVVLDLTDGFGGNATDNPSCSFHAGNQSMYQPRYSPAFAFSQQSSSTAQGFDAPQYHPTYYTSNYTHGPLHDSFQNRASANIPCSNRNMNQSAGSSLATTRHITPSHTRAGNIGGSSSFDVMEEQINEPQIGGMEDDGMDYYYSCGL